MIKKKIVILLSIILLAIVAQMIFSPLLTRLSVFMGMSPTFPTPEDPVNTLSGVIGGKELNSLTIILNNKKVYKVKITNETIITGPIPATLPETTAFSSFTLPQPKKLTFDDLKEGEAVSVNTLTDLRDVKITEFEATSIQVP